MKAINIDESVMPEFLLIFGSAWTSTSCSVCGSPKWVLYPFCRSCSIKLQRAHLYSRFFAVLRNREVFGECTPALIRKLALHWDRCRDYLLNRNRIPAIVEASE